MTIDIACGYNSHMGIEQRVSSVGEHLTSKKVPNLFRQVTLLPVGALKEAQRRMHSERGSSGKFMMLALSVSAALIITSLSQSCYDTGQDQEIRALQAAVARLTIPTEVQTPEVKLVTEPQNTAVFWYQQETITIRSSNEFRPSKVNTGILSESRRPEKLVNWEDILEINGVSIKGAKLLQVRNPLITWGAVENPSSGNVVLDIFRTERSTYYDVVGLQAVVKNKDNKLVLERRTIYLPVNTPESQSFVEGFTKRGSRIQVETKNGRYYHHALIGEINRGEISASQIGIVTTQ